VAPRVLEVTLATSLAGSVEVASGDSDDVEDFALDATILSRRGPHLHLGADLGIHRWINDDTDDLGGDASHLVHVGAIARWVFGTSEVTPFVQLGAGIGMSKIGDGFGVLRTGVSDDTAIILNATGWGYTYHATAGVRVAVGASVLLVADLGVEGASMYHRTRLEDGSGSSSESEMALELASVHLRAGFALPF
jgi:hypothetical protein